MKKRLATIMCFIIVMSCSGCNIFNKSKNDNVIKEINICTDMSDKDSNFLINFVKNEYENKNPKCRVSISNVKDFKEIESLLNNNKVDLIVTNRNNMINLGKHGLIGELSKQLEDNKIKERYYDIITYYGTYDNNIYGFGLIPFSVEIIYNKKVADKMGITYPKDINAFYKSLKELNKKGIKIPVILPEEIQWQSVLFSTALNNTSYQVNLEEYYDSFEKYYDISKNIQGVFRYINSLYKNEILTSKTFTRSYLEELKGMNYDEVPFMIVTYGQSGLSKNEALNDYEVINFSDKNFKNPIIVSPIICMNNSSVEKKEVGEFLKFIYSEEFQKKLLEKGFYTGNKTLNKNAIKNSGNIPLEHIIYGNKRNMLTSEEIPIQINSDIEKVVLSILNGKYTEDEWKKIIKKVYPMTTYDNTSNYSKK